MAFLAYLVYMAYIVYVAYMTYMAYMVRMAYLAFLLSFILFFFPVPPELFFFPFDGVFRQAQRAPICDAEAYCLSPRWVKRYYILFLGGGQVEAARPKPAKNANHAGSI